MVKSTGVKKIYFGSRQWIQGLMARGQGQGLEVQGQGQGLQCKLVLEDKGKDFPRCQVQHWVTVKNGLFADIRK